MQLLIKLPEGKTQSDFCRIRPIEFESNGHERKRKFACKKFSCRVCGPYVRLRFQAQVIQGMEDSECSFLTLTVRSGSTTINSMSDINNAWNKWKKRIYRRLGRFEFVKIVELQRNGTPHIHAIVKKPVTFFQVKRFSEWNKHKNRNDYWVDKNSWLTKHWQEVIHDKRTDRISINEIKGSKENIAGAATDLAKYLSKARSKYSGKNQRWYSFSDGFRGCRPRIGELGSTYVPFRTMEFEDWLGLQEYETHKWEECNEEKGVCDCRRPVIHWNYEYRNNNEHRNVFINTALIEMLIGGHKKWVLSRDQV